MANEHAIKTMDPDDKFNSTISFSDSSNLSPIVFILAEKDVSR